MFSQYVVQQHCTPFCCIYTEIVRSKQAQGSVGLVLVLSSCWSYCLTTNSNPQVVVVGKIIIDEHILPSQDSTATCISVGSSGPQATFGAAAALAILSNDTSDLPRRQPVSFVAPIGYKDWSNMEDKVLCELTRQAVQSIHLLRGEGLIMPRSQLWHNKDQNIHWKKLFDSLGSASANKLWNNQPCANNIIWIVKNESSVLCHAILEGGVHSAGYGQDIAFLKNDNV
jgi:hypothetical protein